MGRPLRLEKVIQAFSPDKAIEDPRQFAGRREEIKSGIQALLSPGSFLIIYGLRGVGKSSIALQIAKIAEGDDTLPAMLKLEGLLPRKGFDFIVHYYRGDAFIRNIGDLLIRILFGDEANPSLFALTKSGEHRLEEIREILQAKGGASMGIAVEAAGSKEKVYKTYISDDLIQQFRSILGMVRRDNQHKKGGILFIIDEFDVIPDKQGFASIVKALSSEYVKFAVVGIGSTVSELISDHLSIGRQVHPIYVDRMDEYELGEILRKAEYLVGGRITFTDEAAEEIVNRSEGFPYFTHLLGRDSMRIAFEHSSPKVTLSDVQESLKKLAEGRFGILYEEMYHEAVKNSQQREILLKLFAEHPQDEIPTEEIYALAKEFGITNPSQLMKPLTSPTANRATPVLVKVRERYYRFSDPVFKVYAKLRDWKF
ncbi:MAG: ATP-binding protein [Gammaproteobacteria bacterium]|nr:ATP-binding protein [Gammaproteobacteria bacterium]